MDRRAFASSLSAEVKPFARAKAGRSHGANRRASFASFGSLCLTRAAPICAMRPFSLCFSTRNRTVFSLSTCRRNQQRPSKRSSRSGGGGNGGGRCRGSLLRPRGTHGESFYGAKWTKADEPRYKLAGSWNALHRGSDVFGRLLFYEVTCFENQGEFAVELKMSEEFEWASAVLTGHFKGRTKGLSNAFHFRDFDLE